MVYGAASQKLYNCSWSMVRIRICTLEPLKRTLSPLRETLQSKKIYRSPLNNAFFIGNADIIRLLMKAGADLEYRNRRSWSSVSYLWEPGRPSHRSTCEILDICAENGFYDWNNTDVMGWSAAHRAAAYGSSDDIRSLAYKGANIHSYTTDQFWGPVTCAVWNSNESTFDALAELLSNEEIVNARDSRGWTLLHFAAQTGSEQLMRKLRVLGVATDALTIPTTLWVTQGLEGKRLTAEVIASEYGYGNSWDKAMMTIDD
jgi:ankyrin repeat protein